MSMFVALGFVLKANRRTLPLFDDELIVLVSLVSFPGKVWRHCQPKISFTDQAERWPDAAWW
jgi:hypothetical protein